MFENYKVAVKLSLISDVATGLLAISQHFKHVSNDVSNFQKQLDRLKLTMVGGGIAFGTGMFGLGLIEKTLAPAREYANQLSLMNTLGLKQVDIAQAVGGAWKVSRDVITTSASENLAAYRELRSAFGAGHENSALASLPVVQRVKSVLTALTGQEQGNVGFDMVKAIELRQAGGMTEASIAKNSEMMGRTLLAMGGTLNVNDFHQALKYGKMATMKWSDDFTYKLLPTLMQEMKSGHGGASTAGTSMYSLYQQVHGTMKKSAYESWITGGLIDPENVVKNATGTWQMKTGAVKDLALFESNPYEWVQRDLAPAISRIVDKLHVTEETAINSLFSNRNASFAAYTMYKKAKQFERDKAMIEQASGSKEAYDKLIKENPLLAQIALQKKWNELLGIIGFQIMPNLIKGTMWLSNNLRDMSGWVSANHGLVKKMTLGFVGLSAALAFGGTVTLLSGAFKALGLALSFGGIGGAAGIRGIAAAIGSASTSGTLLFGLAALGVAVGGMAYALTKLGNDNKDPYNHPGMKWLTHGRGHVGEWVVDPNQSQEHAGQHFKRFGRGGVWINDTEVQAVKPKNYPDFNVTVVSKLDGKEIARSTTKIQAREAAKPHNGQSAFDSSMTPLPIAMAFNR